MATMKVSCSNVAQRVAGARRSVSVLPARRSAVCVHANASMHTEVRDNKEAQDLATEDHFLSGSELAKCPSRRELYAGAIGPNICDSPILQVSKAVAVSTAAATLLYSGNALAAQELVGTIAEADNRVGVILTLFVPVLGWVGFNMLQPFFNQVHSFMGRTLSDIGR